MHIDGQRRSRGAPILVFAANLNSWLEKNAPCRHAGALRKAPAPVPAHELILILSIGLKFCSRHAEELSCLFPVVFVEDVVAVASKTFQRTKFLCSEKDYCFECLAHIDPSFGKFLEHQGMLSSNC